MPHADLIVENASILTMDPDTPRAEAIAQLQALGLKVRVDEGIVTPLDRVYSQDPTPGSSAPVGSTVTLSVF